MKVTREEKFTPITIVLETKEEADIMWHLLNMPTSPVQNNADQYGFKISYSNHSSMFESYNLNHDARKS